MKKNDCVELNITALTGEGTGVGKSNGMAVFVPGAAVGDTLLVHIIKVKSRYAIGKLLQVITPSPYRKEVDCSSFKNCGGCAFRHITYEAELKAKETSVKDAMQRIGGTAISPCKIIPSPKTVGYRNKAQYPLSVGSNGIIYGFFARHSHRVIENRACQLQPTVFDDIMQTIVAWAEENGVSVYDEATGNGLLRHVLIRIGEKTGEIMVVPVINGDTLPFAEQLILNLESLLGANLKSLCFNINKKNTNVIMGDKNVLLYGDDKIKDVICGVSLEISPLSFYQVNRSAAELLYNKAAEYIDSFDKVIVDLYCGIGSIGLSVLNICGSQGRSLYGVEIIPSAVENAKKNAKNNNFDNCEFICADAADAAEKLKRRGIRPDVVILDPPRKGCVEELLDTVSFGFSPKKIIYISCDPATLSRDSKKLEQNGYKLVEYTPVDLFPSTAHVETVALLRQEKAVHNMELNPAPYAMIKSRQKTIELRLFDEKRQKIKAGDTIVFTNTNTGETQTVTVVKLHRFNNFEELYKSLPLLQCGYTTENVDKARPSDMEQYYSVEEQKNYGVVGIELC